MVSRHFGLWSKMGSGWVDQMSGHPLHSYDLYNTCGAKHFSIILTLKKAMTGNKIGKLKSCCHPFSLWHFGLKIQKKPISPPPFTFPSYPAANFAIPSEKCNFSFNNIFSTTLHCCLLCKGQRANSLAPWLLSISPPMENTIKGAAEI